MRSGRWCRRASSRTLFLAQSDSSPKPSTPKPVQLSVVLTVNEIFYSIQGESTHAGRPCVFVRLTGCDLRCTWCDTTYSFHEGRKMSVDDVVDGIDLRRAIDEHADSTHGRVGEPLPTLLWVDVLNPCPDVNHAHHRVLSLGHASTVGAQVPAR